MSHTLTPHINLWLECEGQVVMSSWRVALLEAVARTGSISSAAEEMHVPYRIAWNKIKEMEQGLGVQLVTTRVGGSDGGGTHLTAAGEEYVQRFRQFSARFEQWIEQQFSEAFAGLL